MDGENPDRRPKAEETWQHIGVIVFYFRPESDPPTAPHMLGVGLSMMDVCEWSYAVGLGRFCRLGTVGFRKNPKFAKSGVQSMVN